MIETYEQELERISKEEKLLAEQYKNARIDATQAKLNLSLALAKHIDKIREGRKNIGFEMAIVELLKTDSDGQFGFYNTSFELKTAEYKGLEKILNALEGRRITIQSLMKYHLKAEIQGE